MHKIVELPDGTEVEFPDGMGSAQMSAVISQHSQPGQILHSLFNPQALEPFRQGAGEIAQDILPVTSQQRSIGRIEEMTGRFGQGPIRDTLTGADIALEGIGLVADFVPGLKAAGLAIGSLAPLIKRGAFKSTRVVDNPQVKSDRLIKAQKIKALREEANANRFGGADLSYRGLHQPTEKEGFNTLDNSSDIYPSDIYNPSVSGRFYGHGDPGLDNKTARIIAQFQGKPEKEIIIYRSVPVDVEGINKGDWVTINKDYASSHGEAWVDDGNFNIVEKRVKAKDLTTSGDSMHEWGYFPD